MGRAFGIATGELLLSHHKEIIMNENTYDTKDGQQDATGEEAALEQILGGDGNEATDAGDGAEIGDDSGSEGEGDLDTPPAQDTDAPAADPCDDLGVPCGA